MIHSGEVHVFACLGHFSSQQALRAWLDPSWTDDGDEVASRFMRAIELTDYEPMCIEAT